MSTLPDRLLQQEPRSYDAAMIESMEEEARASHLYVASRELVPAVLQTHAYAFSAIGHYSRVGTVMSGKEQVAEEIAFRARRRKRFEERYARGDCKLTLYIGDTALTRELVRILPGKADRIEQLEALRRLQDVHVFASSIGLFPPILKREFNNDGLPSYWVEPSTGNRLPHRDTSGEAAAIFAQLKAATSTPRNPYVRNNQASQTFISHLVGYLQVGAAAE